MVNPQGASDSILALVALALALALAPELELISGPGGHPGQCTSPAYSAEEKGGDEDHWQGGGKSDLSAMAWALAWASTWEVGGW